MRPLAPEHLQDLRASGLSDDTVTALHIAAVRPHDLRHLHGVTSAYAIPYFHLDGTLNEFKRLKLFPPIKTESGTMRYWQPPNTLPNLYCPPVLNWLSVAKNVRVQLILTEGEKKGAKGCQHGLITAAVGGNWCHTATLDTGDRLTLPMLDEFQWLNRPVLICPDSDAWGSNDKGRNILAGFFALAKDLQQRGACVQFVVLPDVHGAKAGLDDWLLVPGNDTEVSWPKLERIALDDPRFDRLNAWWQGWRDKQALEQDLRTAQADDYDLQEVAGQFTVRFPAYRVRFRFDQLTTTGSRVGAELTVRLSEMEVLGVTDVGLKAGESRNKIATNLAKLTAKANIPWKRLLERACSAVLARYRVGEPIVVLEPAASAQVPFLVNPFIYAQHQTLWYAPGGSLKSYLALWLALLAAHGHHHAGVSTVPVRVLYLDWELNASTVGGRLKALRAGHPELSQQRPFYRRCETPLHQEAHHIASEVAERRVELLIVDSAAMACGGNLTDPEAAIKLQRALRMIGCASLVLAHVSKTTPEGQDRTAYGTVFFRELARNVWEVAKAETDGPDRIILKQTKNNFGPKAAPLGLTVEFLPEAVRIDACDPNAEPALEDKLPLPNRIRNLLEDGTPRSVKEIAVALGAKVATVRVTLSKYHKTKWHRIGDYHDGQWTVLNR